MTWIDRPILVTGLPRSGTSLVAGVLSRCGAWTGRTVRRGPSNPRGFFENRELREEVVKPLLAGLGRDPLGVASLPALDELPLARADALRRDVCERIARQGYRDEGPWLFKDAKLSLLWPLWSAAFPAARWVIVRRDRAEIVASCLRTHFLAHHSDDPAFWERLVGEYLERLAALEGERAWTQRVWPAELIAGEHGAARGLVDLLGLGWNERRVTRFVSPRFWGGGG